MPVIRDRLIKGDSKYAVDYITDAHAAYKYYYNRWQFLGDSYHGGYDYFMGRYMEPYYYESRDDYEKRLRQVALDNHVNSITGIYTSFLFRKNPKRDAGSLANNPNLEAFLKDADLDGRSFDSFIKDVSTFAMVYGNCWVIIDKPTTQVNTRAEQLQQNIRPYVSMFTPDNVLDWKYERQLNGSYELTYLKVREEIIEDEQYVREYTKDEINVYKIFGKDKRGEYVETFANTLGRIPAVCVYAKRSNIRGIGISTVGDIADFQKMIYEEYSEIEQIIRLTNHPTLVKTVDTEASAGAGSIIQLPQNLDGALRPYLLQPNGSSIESVLNSITRKIEAIDRMACLGGIRSIESRRLSGVGLQTEFQMLAAKLSDFAANMENAEEQIWDIWAQYEGSAFDGEISYPRSFSIQDKANDIEILKMAKDAAPTNKMITDKLDKMILETVTEKTWNEVKEWYEEWKSENAEIMEESEEESEEEESEEESMEHPTQTDPAKLIAHIREMIDQGYTDQQIRELHPEISTLLNNGEDQV